MAKAKQKTVKAWAVIGLRGGIRWDATRAYSFNGDVPGQDVLAIFPKAETARNWHRKWRNKDQMTVVPVDITYTVPSNKTS